ncbi:hypothetical protein G6F35_016259 [Rhizopus arrhizus]|nr:hypothetical protein G6F35_016259 [Rhizopus arrhizus]
MPTARPPPRRSTCVRADHYKTEYASASVCGGRGGPVCGSNPTGTVLRNPTLDASDTLLNWKLGALYKVGETVSVYANYALSQQPPGGANFQLSSSASSADNPKLDPQKAKTFEVGSKPMWKTKSIPPCWTTPATPPRPAANG